MQIDREVIVAMRDGTRLAADVYRPEDDAAHPALLQRTPYDRRNNALYLHAATVDLVGAVADGYAVVVQDCRGRFGSQGDWIPFVHEADDGYDTVEWVAAQPWCNGHVGVYGNSYIANTALQAAVAAPPHLDAVFSFMGGCGNAGGWCYTNGVLELSFLFYWLSRGAQETLRRASLPPDEAASLSGILDRLGLRPRRAVESLPVANFEAWQPALVPFIEDWLGHPAGGQYWNAFSVALRAEEIQVPVLHITGAHDNLAAGHFELAGALSRHPSTAVRERHRFIFGPWDHEAYMSSRPATAGEVDFGPTAPNGFALNSQLTRTWFDFWLRGEGSGLEDRAVVSYYETGSETWRSAPSWPPETSVATFDLMSDGQANTRFGDGRLVTAQDTPPTGADFDSFTYDPLNPVPTTGGRTLCPPLGMPGVVDQRVVEERGDVLVYTTPPLTSDLGLCGAATLHLSFSSTCEDTDITAKLVDVEEDGYARNVTEGIARARYRAGLDREEFLEPGVPAEIVVPLSPVTHRFAPGHHLRLEVSSSNFPHFERNLNSRVHPHFAGESDRHVAEQRVYHETDCRSWLELQVIR